MILTINNTNRFGYYGDAVFPVRYESDFYISRIMGAAQVLNNFPA
jgi:hypothetical protein